MSKVEMAVRRRLVSEALLTALVGTRVFLNAAAQDATLPYIVMNRLSGDHRHHLLGPLGVVTARIQIDIYAATYVSAQAVEAIARPLLDGLIGTTIGSAPNEVFVQSSVMQDDQDLWERPSDGSEKGKHRRRMVFNVTHNQATS